MKANLFFLVAFVYQITCQVEEDINAQLDPLEKDKIMTCAEMVSRKFQTESKTVNDITSSLGADKENAASKISADMFSTCMNRIDEATTRQFFNNLEFYDFEWSDDLDSLVSVDLAKYKGQTDFEFTPEQHLLFYKLEKVRTEYISKNKEKTEKDRNTMKIAGYDLNAISPEMKLIYFLIVFAAMTLGMLYLLSKVMKKEKVSKKKKNK